MACKFKKGDFVKTKKGYSTGSSSGGCYYKEGIKFIVQDVSEYTGKGNSVVFQPNGKGGIYERAIEHRDWKTRMGITDD